MRAEGSCKVDGERADGLSHKIGEERADGLIHKIGGKIDAGIIRKDLVMNEMMCSTANDMSERRNTASWCGSRVAGWRVAVVRTSASLVDVASSALVASLVSPDKKWNVMVPRMKMTTTHRKRVANVMPVTAVSALTTLLVQLALKASKAPEDRVTSIAPVASMVASMASIGGFDGFDGLCGTNCVHGSGFGGLGGLDGLGDSSKKEITEE